MTCPVGRALQPPLKSLLAKLTGPAPSRARADRRTGALYALSAGVWLLQVGVRAAELSSGRVIMLTVSALLTVGNVFVAAYFFRLARRGGENRRAAAS